MAKIKRPTKKIPANCQAASMVSQIAALKENQCCSRNIYLDDSVTLGEVKENMGAWRRRLLASIQSSVAYAKRRLGQEGVSRVFSIETSFYMTGNAALVLNATVKREPDYVEL